MHSRHNAFDLLRLILAFLVLFSHAYLLGNYPGEPLILFSKGQISFGDIGVMGFFTLSGYLISASYDRLPDVLHFVRNRLLRIFPGFWVCLLVTGFLIAPAIIYLNDHQLSGFAYWGNMSAFSFFYENALLPIHQWSVQHVLDHSAYNASLNGSLWSLWPEMQCYIAVLAMGLLGLFRRNRAMLLLSAAFVYVIYVINLISPVHYGPTIFILSNAFRLYVSFLCGMMLYVYGKYIDIDKKGYIFLLLLSLMLLRFGGFLVVAPVIVSVFCVKFFSTFHVSLRYDISYGLYIYAFPVEQLAYNAFGHRLPFVPYVLLCLLITAMMAFLSFRIVEQPFLRFKSHHKRKAEELPLDEAGIDSV